MKNKDSTLQGIKPLLNDFFAYFKAPTMLAVSEDKATLPFAFVINEPTYDNHLLVSVAVDYQGSINVAHVVSRVASVLSVKISEPFYISLVDGNTYFGDEAFTRWDLESMDISQMEPVSDEKH